MNEQKTVLVDLDSIVANLDKSWYGIYNEEHGDDLSVERVLTWDVHRYCKAGKAVYKILERPGLFRNLEPIEGAVEAVQELVNRKYDVCIITAAEFPQNYTEKIEWCRQHLPFLTKHQVGVWHQKHKIPAHALIDDGPHNAEAYRRAHPNAKIMTIGYPYNFGNPNYDLIAGDWRDTRAAWARILEELP